ncbi:hypothetical protein B0H65DRAFT_437170 [Neurospora tetraspora]|uniref:Uncharacterized protein n=1 Tax=Neurospora tetraspora TaxID=94610 RepID=A0AAE0IZX9_9PEZI|nr:hypothetical protein B0H65DRAFT_437170 [Neurospora tetraspora]
MPKRPRAMAPAADQAAGEPNEDRRKRLRMALAVEKFVEQAFGEIYEEMNKHMPKMLRSKLLEFYEKEWAEGKNKEQNQRKVSLESATGSDVVEQPAGETLTMEEVSKTIGGLLAMLETQKKQDQCETSLEPGRVSGDVDVVDMAEETTGGSDRDMDQDEDDDEDDDDIYLDSDDDEDSDGYSDGRGWYCLADNDMYADEDESENEEANAPDNEYIPSPWSVGDPSTPKDPFLEDSPQVDLMGTFHNERGNHNRADQAVDPLLRDPVILSLKSEADYENYHKRPRIDFDRYEWRP